MWCSVRVRWVGLLSLFACANLFGQSASHSDRRTTFHVSGKITQLGRAVHDEWVSFEGSSSKFVKADSAGHYEADLTLGVWKVAVMAVPGPITKDSSLSRPRLFQVRAPGDVTLDLFERADRFCTVSIGTANGRPPTKEELERQGEGCAGQEFFSMPSNEGIPFEVIVGGPTHGLSPVIDKDSREREFATYNLLTVQADKVIFTPSPHGGLLEATGSVVISDGHREYRRNSVRFLIGAGQAVESY